MGDFFIEDTEEQKPITKNSQEVPPEYIEVKLSSAGKLSAPPRVHVRDYNGKDLVNLGLSSTEDMLRSLVQVMNNVIWEDVDVKDFHEHEMEEILMNIYANFWTPIIQGYPFPYTQEEWNALDDERKERVKKGIEKFEVDINITEQLNTNPLPDDFKEPIKIAGKDHTVSFILPRVGHYFIAEDYIDNTYAQQDQKFADIDKKVKFNNAETDESKKKYIDPVQLREYRDYIRQRNSDYILVKQSQMIHKLDGKKLESLEEKIEAYDHVDMRMWTALNDYLANKLGFGIDKNVTMRSPIDGSIVTRRCRFRPMDFLPSDDLQNTGEYTIQFGDE